MRLSGSITALVTPFTGTGEIDFDAWRRLLQAQLEGGTQALVVAGSTGEAATLYEAEYDALLRTAVECVAGQVPVVAGTGLSGTARTVEQTRRAAALGADAALVVTPPYVRPTQAGLLAHYRKVAAGGGLPVVLYNVPARTGCDLLPETVAELAGEPGIIGIKEAHGAPGRLAALLALRSDTFTVLGGDDATALHAMLAGADGVVSVVSNAVPRACRRLCDLARAGRDEEAAQLDARLQELHAFSNIEPNPIPIKALLGSLGIGAGLRLPLQRLSDKHMSSVARLARDVAEIEQSCRDAVAA